MANTSISGLVSGLDTATIISQLMQIEAQPQTALKNRVTSEQNQIGSLQTLNAKLASVASRASALAQASSWTPNKATSSSTDVTATADATATPASLTFTVNSIARGSSVSYTQSSSTDTVVFSTATDIKIASDDGSSTTIAGFTGTLQDLTSALNATGKVNAALVATSTSGTPTYQLQVSSVGTGADSGFAITAGGVPLLGGPTTKSPEQSYQLSAADPTVATATAPVGATYTITMADGTAKSFSTGTGSLQDIAANINASGSGVTAKVVDVGHAGAASYRLQVDSADGSSFSISDGTSTPFLGGVYTNKVGADASIDINGNTLTSTSNTIADLMPGVDVTLGAKASGPVTITVAHDAKSLSDQVQGMVDAVNAALDDIDSLTSYNASTKTAGLLSGDSTLRAVRDQLLSAVSSGIGGKSLASVGIQTDKTGKLTFDSSKFTAAYNADPTGTANLFAGTVSYNSAVGTGTVKLQSSSWRTVAGTYAVTQSPPSIAGLTASVSGTLITGATGSPVEGMTLDVGAGATRTITYSQGIAAKFEALAQRASNADSGSVTTEINGRNADIKDMNGRIDDWDVRLSARQDALQRQYAALEVALGKMQDQASWLSGQISSLPKVGG